MQGRGLEVGSLSIMGSPGLTSPPPFFLLSVMADVACYHCGREIPEGQHHDCWSTTEAHLTRDLSEDLRDAWERLRETAAGFGEQRIYASHNSIMFSRKTCYFFVRPKKSALEVVFFLGRTLKAPEIRKVQQASSKKTAHTIRIVHRDQVEPPVTAWLREAYETSPDLTGAARPQAASKKTKCKKKTTGISAAQLRRISKSTRAVSSAKKKRD